MLVALMVTTIGCDQATKHLAATSLATSPRLSYLGDTLRLEYTENRGAFLSLGAGLPAWARTALFTVATGLLLAAMAVIALRDRWAGRGLVGLSLAWAGGVSNVVDRAARGSVVDFLNVGVGPLRTGVFNVADMAILFGLALVLSQRLGSGPPADPPRPSSPGQQPDGAEQPRGW